MSTSNATLRSVSFERELEDLSADGVGNNLVSNFEARVALFLLVSFLLCVISILVVMAFRQYLWPRHRIVCCPCKSRVANNNADDVPPNNNDRVERALARDAAYATEIQRGDNELQERRRRERRMQRRTWYEYYLKRTKSVHVVTEEDFVFTGDEGAKSVMVPCYKHPDSRYFFDSTCTICFCDYEVGDRIVRSPLGKCKHVFCKDCMFVWLSKGKKRCPMCREWFVPASRIADQINAEFELDPSENPTSSSESSEGEH